MRADSTDRLEADHARERLGSWLIGAAVVAVIGAVLYYWLAAGPEPDGIADEPVVRDIERQIEAAAPPPPAPEPQPAPAPPPEPTPAPTEPAPEPLPALADSDPLVRQSLKEALGEGQASSWLPEDEILRRQAVLLNALQRGTVLRKPLPLPAPEGRFQAVQRGERLLLSEKNYRRYEALVTVLETVDAAALGRWYRRFEPLLGEAWAELGNPPGGLRRAITQTLELAIATPDIDGALDLVQPGVMYKYADPALEALPDVQKLLLRVGPSNRARIKAQCRRLLEALP